MKKQIISVILIFVCSVYILNAQQRDEHLYVYAVTGLKLREKPNTRSEIKDTIPYGKKVRILDYNTGIRDTIISGLKGKFIKAKYKDLEGWLFSGYLSKIKPPSLADRWLTFYDYLEEKHKRKGSETIVKVPSIHDTSYLKTGRFQKYSDDIEFYDFGEDCAHEERMVFKECSVQEGFLFLTTFHLQYRNVSLGVPGIKDCEKEYCETEIEPNTEYQYNRMLSVKKDSSGNIFAIDICFDTEAGSGCVYVRKSKTNPNNIILEFSYHCD